MTLSPEKMQKVYEIQRQMHQKFRNVPKEGKMVEYLGDRFFVSPGVFWPSWDSEALIKNYIINPEEEVCDVCTGCGVITIYSALKEAKKVVALDVNPNAIECTRWNASFYGLSEVVEARTSDVFSALKEGERFDVVTMNPPFTFHPREKQDHVEVTTWDPELHVQKSFIQGLDYVLKKNDNARAYVTQANFGAIDEMLQSADEKGFSVREIGRNVVDDLRTFYAFELKRKQGGAR